MKRLLLMLLGLLIFSNYLSAKSDTKSVVDSLNVELSSCKEDSARVKILLAIASQYGSKDTSTAFEYLDKALTISEKSNWEVGVIKTLLKRATLLGRSGNYTKGVECDNKALRHAQKLGNESFIAASLHGLGYDYYHLSNFEASLKYLKEALLIFENLGNRQEQSSIYNRIANIYLHKGNYPTALEYYFKALDVKEQLGDKISTARTVANIGVLYRYIDEEEKALGFFQKSLKVNLDEGYTAGAAPDYINCGISYRRLGDTAKAIASYNKALTLYKEMNNLVGQVICYTNIANLYQLHGDDALAETYYLKALEINEQHNDLRHKAGAYASAGYFFSTIGYQKRALHYVNKALSITKKAGLLSDVSDNYKKLYTIYKSTKQPNKALLAFEQYIVFRDSVYNEKNTKEITRLEVQSVYEKELLADSLRNEEHKREAAIKLQRQKIFSYSGIVVVIVLVVFSFFIVKERRKSDKLLLNILPNEVANELKDKGASDAKLFDNVTVLFTDFVGFTMLAEKFTPEELVHELDTCFKEFDNIIGKYGIEKIKTVGDAYLAVCGLPTADERHAEKVVGAAQEIRAFMVHRHQELGDKTFEVRVGVHSGDVVAGIVGVKKFAYDIWGDTVNTAARMEQNSEAGKINISQTTYELVKDKYTCTYRGELEAKNKGKLKMYFVEA